MALTDSDESGTVVLSALRSINIDAEHLTWDQLETMTLRDLGVTSLLLFDFVSALEERGGFAFEDDDVDLDKFQQPHKVRSMVSRYLSDR